MQIVGNSAERLVKTSTPEEFTEWIIKYHRARESSRPTLVSNIREQMDRAYMSGRVDQRPSVVVVANSAMKLEIMIGEEKSNADSEAV